MNIELKKWNEADLDAVSHIFTDCDRSYLSDSLPMPYTRGHAEDWYNSHVRKREGVNGLYRLIYTDGNPVGVITLERGESFSCMDAELGYLLLDTYKGKGITTRAIDLFCTEAFSILNILRISARIFSPNAASRRVLEKNGFTLEGTMKNAVIKGESIYDLLLFGRLK